jgi:hypothetical protein
MGSALPSAEGKLYTVTCPQCRRRPAKRACPGLLTDICPTCCATKRLVEIRCPADCRFLDATQRHPAAVVRRQQERDLSILIGAMGRRLTEVQLQVFFLLASVVVRFRPDGLLTMADADVADAAGAMAGTLEAATRGVIAELTGASPLAEGLRRQFDALLAELGKGAGARFAQDAAEVLRGIERGARHEAPGIGAGERDYLALVGRILPPVGAEPAEAPRSPIIIP